MNSLSSSFIAARCTLCTSLLPIIMLISGPAFSQAPATEWQKRYGSFSSDCLSAVSPTADGGYISAGLITVLGVAFSYNYWIVKTDAAGNMQWQQHYGGHTQDYATTILQTADGGYIVGGNASSHDGDVSGNHGTTDIWLLKLDAAGNIQWKKCYGGSMNEYCGQILELPGGGYMVAATTTSDDGDLAGLAVISSFGESDAWLFRLDAMGNIAWSKTYGGTGSDMASDIKALPGGGYIVAGATSSNNGDVSGNHGSEDVWIFEVNTAGNIIWQKCLGGTNREIAMSIAHTPDNGFVAVGYTESGDGDVTGFHGGVFDTWVVKLDAAGNLLWQKALGGSDYDMGRGVVNQPDGSYVIISDSRSADGDITAPLGSDDVWLAALDNSGNLVWQKNYGGSAEDGNAWGALGMGMAATPDGGLVFSSMTGSPEVTGGDIGWDGYLVKIKRPECDTTAGVATDTGLCVAQPFSITLTSATGSAYTWNNGTHAANIEVQDTGTYWCTSALGCNLHTDTFRLHHAITVTTHRYDTTVCANTKPTITASDGYEHYLWNTGDTTQYIQAATTAVYYCVGTDDCRSNTETFAVHHKTAIPQPALGPDRELCSDTDPQIGIPYPDVQYLWSTEDTDYSIHITTSGSYTLTISNGCETAQDSVYIRIADCNNCFTIPTAFSPNNDGLNDAFGAIMRCTVSKYNLSIYDRWGNLVFTGYNPGSKWDGTSEGQQMPVGTYYYAITMDAPDGRVINSKGDVTLVR